MMMRCPHAARRYAASYMLRGKRPLFHFACDALIAFAFIFAAAAESFSAFFRH